MKKKPWDVTVGRMPMTGVLFAQEGNQFDVNVEQDKESSVAGASGNPTVPAPMIASQAFRLSIIF